MNYAWQPAWVCICIHLVLCTWSDSPAAALLVRRWPAHRPV